MSNQKSVFFLSSSACYLLALLLSSIALQGNETVTNKRPNIVFILTDDQRYDEIAAIGNFPWLKTPNLDLLVNNGVTFENAFTTMQRGLTGGGHEADSLGVRLQALVERVDLYAQVPLPLLQCAIIGLSPLLPVDRTCTLLQCL